VKPGHCGVPHGDLIEGIAPDGEGFVGQRIRVAGSNIDQECGSDWGCRRLGFECLKKGKDAGPGNDLITVREGTWRCDRGSVHVDITRATRRQHRHTRAIDVHGEVARS